MKRVLFAAVLAATIGVSHAQITVVAPATDAMTQVNQAVNMAEQVKRLTELKNQLKQAEKQFDALTGSRGLGSLHNDVKGALSDTWTGDRDRARKGTISGQARTEYEERAIFDRCSAKRTTEEMRLCRGSAYTATQDRVMWEQANKRANERVDQIDKLVGEINKTKDPKEIAELQARIAGEEAMVANERNRMETASAAIEAAEREQQELERQSAVKEASKTGGIKLDSVKW